MPWLHPPEPLGAGGCTLACTARRPGPAASWSECSRGVYAIAAHSSPRCPLRGAQRSAGTVAMRVHRGMRRSEDARAQPRPSPAGTGASPRRDGIAGHRPIPPFCVTTTTPIQRHRRTAAAAAIHAQFRPGFLRPLVLQRKVRYDGIHVTTFPRHSAAGLSASEPRPLRRSPQGLSDLRARRRRRYVDDPARIGTGSPSQAVRARGRAVPIDLSEPSRSVFEAVPMPVLAAAIPRLLPGFSGSSQVHLSQM